MAKIEEITALMINEIDTFKSSVSQLQKVLPSIQKEVAKIENIHIKVDTSSYDQKFSQLLHKIELNYARQTNQLEQFKDKLKKRITIPNWVIIIFTTFVSLLLISSLYNFYHYKNAVKIKNEAYQKGKTQIETHIISFFDAYPNSYKTYKKWQDEK
ncbi:DUF6730 family protein [Polaribacter glomeratus]|uniref:Uncharacterized protein n=1 Tax=Polaribacter glomeratus TaxID=102 RepID=A0A2S7WYF1_9FLAO|nr:DUF6730 family protein [Polaribacter glomeratus]PQJ82617.1 hypothetical protein BTO16_08525 [Polaribacter glomeratus]TXD64927.1 peptidoglycan bridge formation glycyltransferase FemA/FemB family protein [Polaribacter glomeratus]